MKILIVGAGYVGIVTGTCFAEMGHHVICLDIDAEKISRLSHGDLPLFEPGLKEMVQRNLAAGRLQFTTDYQLGVEASQVCFLAVNTPRGVDGHADLRYFDAAVRSIASHMHEYRVIVNKSTVPVGTSEHVKQLITEVLEKRGVDIPFDVVSNPEFLKEGDAINDCLKPDRVIIGAENARAAALVRDIYTAFTLSHDRILHMDCLSAELTKYAANAMLATRISFMNELSILCEHLGADIKQVRMGIGSDHRIGYHFLYAGAGFGGSCFPKDLEELQARATSIGSPLSIIDAVMAINERQKQLLGQKIYAYFSSRGGLQGKTIGILGLSFKPNTDDMREAPSRTLIEQLLSFGASLRLYDPVAMPHAQQIFRDAPRMTWCQNELETATGAHALVLVTEWRQFRFLAFEELMQVMEGRAFFDGRNQYLGEEVARQGFDYVGIGRPPHFATQSPQLQLLS